MDNTEKQYKALYRKWRPETFADVVGQEHITRVLASEVMTGSVSHAYLFCGSRGTGKTTCAKIFASAVNCDSPVNGDPCGKCQACSVMKNSFDIVEMDAASNNGVDEIRRLREEVLYPPSEMKKKVYIIDEVHMLSQGAFNALLKTLEEPPEHVLFILATTELNKIPATILSRCKRFDFRRITPESIFGRLKYICNAEKIAADDGALRLISRLATGALRDALSMLEMFVGSKEIIDEKKAAAILGVVGRDTVISILSAVGKRDTGTALSEAAKVYDSGKDMGVLCSECSELVRDMLVIKYLKNPDGLVESTPENLERIRECASLFTAERLNFCADVLEEASGRIAKNAFSRRTCFETALLRMSDLRLSEIPETLVTRFGELESKVARLEARLSGLGTGASTVSSVPSITTEGDAPSPSATEKVSEVKVDTTFDESDIPPASDGDSVYADVPFDIPEARSTAPSAKAVTSQPKPVSSEQSVAQKPQSEATLPSPYPTAPIPSEAKPQKNAGAKKPLEALPEIESDLYEKDKMFRSYLNEAKAYFDGDAVVFELIPFFCGCITRSDEKTALIKDSVEKHLGYAAEVRIIPKSDGSSDKAPWTI